MPRQWSQAQNLFTEMTQEELQADLILNAKKIVSLMERFLADFLEGPKLWNIRNYYKSMVS